MKKYTCIWGSWNSKALFNYDHQMKVVDDYYFSDENGQGYGDIDRDLIAKLQPGEIMEHETGNHLIIRHS